MRERSKEQERQGCGETEPRGYPTQRWKGRYAETVPDALHLFAALHHSDYTHPRGMSTSLIQNLEPSSSTTILPELNLNWVPLFAK